MLRPAAHDDSHAVAKVLLASRRAFLPYAPSPHTPAAFMAWLTDHLLPSNRVTVAVCAGEVVAVLAVSEDDSTAWIDQLYVLPGHENQGHGSRLLHHAHGTLKRPIRLFTFQQNIRARRFYERHGYKVVSTSDGQQNEEKTPDVLYELAAGADAEPRAAAPATR